jgi:hypothetical protein
LPGESAERVVDVRASTISGSVALVHALAYCMTIAD